NRFYSGLDWMPVKPFTCAMFRFRLSAMLVAMLAMRAVAGEPIRASGVLTPMLEIEVGSELRGTIVWLAEEGSVVSKGQPLVKLRDSIERFTVDLRKAQLDAARYALDRHKKDFEAGKILQTQKIINEEEMRTREFNYLNAQSQLDQAIANHKLALEDVTLRTVYAPLNCVVLRQLKKIGETLVVSAGVENILRVVHIDSLYFVAYPNGKFAGQIKLGQKAEILLSLRPQEKLAGEVTYVDPGVEANSGSIRVKILVKNPDHKIPHGLHGVATFLPGN
ncbi:MAG: efflux RND transporter periplasmic adaptor subunit, partial [Verrucomicrobia bacterium]|nr:efflux RND transporter periplasmic adaptor subunit [Verrucomicrobiota bacterium]